MWRTVWRKVRRELITRSALNRSAEERRRLERRLRGQDELAMLKDADAVIVSFGKSGRTWLRVLISRFYQRRFGLGESSLIGFDNFHRRDPAMPRLLFTHDNYLRDYTGHRDSKADFYDSRVVLLVRHPIDIAVSQYFHWKHRMRPAKKALNLYPAHGRDLELYDFLIDEGSGLPKIIAFLNGWVREFPRLERILVVRYEDLRAATEREFGRVMTFLGEKPRAEELADCVRFASIDNMRQLETTNVFWRAGGRMRAKDKSNPDSYKVRRAKVGGYRDYLSDEQIAAVEAMVERDLLPGLGYLSREARTSAEPALDG